MIPPSEIEHVALRAFPATTGARIGEWVLRSDALLPNRRVNSAWDLGDPGLPLDETMAHVRRWYRERARRPIVKTTIGSPADQLLSDWDAEAATGVHVQGTRDSPNEGVTFMARDRLPEWSAAFTEVRGLGAARADGLVAAYRSLTDLGLAIVSGDDGPIAVGLGVIDGEWIGIFDVATAPHARRRGFGSRITSSLIGWGHERGATTAYLQVEEENTAAITLYARLGFSRNHGYHYRVDRAGVGQSVSPSG